MKKSNVMEGYGSWPHFRNANDLAGSWEQHLPPALQSRVSPEFRFILNQTEQNVQRIQGQPVVPGSICVIIPTTVSDEGEYLPHTIKRLIRHLRAARLFGDIYVIVNDGQANQASYLVPSNIETLKTDLGIHRFGFADIHRSDENREDASKPGVVEMNPGIAAHNTETIRLVTLYQGKARSNSGKIRALRDISAYLAMRGLRFQYLYLMDSESILYARNHKNDEGCSQDLFLKLVQASNNGTRIVCPKLFLVPFKSGMPDFAAVIPPVSYFLSALHGQQTRPGFSLISKLLRLKPVPDFGRYPFSFLMGGSVLGDYGLLLGMIQTIAQRYPGLRTEDSLLGSIARALCVDVYIHPDVVNANRCPRFGPHDRKKLTFTSLKQDIDAASTGISPRLLLTDDEYQKFRWMRGIEGMARVFGKAAHGFVA
ncbi:MAG: hypothetical protein LJE65_09480, partial [Desulfobacteraceae bacterium]|nr:hypothetical protein [Desulfobacteraceae bacterium]